MLNTDPVKIPDVGGKIRIANQDGIDYVRYLVDRKYDADKKRCMPDWVNIGKRIPEMPGMMYPNRNYYQYFGEEREEMDATMTEEEKEFVRKDDLYQTYKPFFDGIFNELLQQSRRNPEGVVNAFKTGNINRILEPLKEMMKGEEYAGFLGTVEEGMSYGDVMILITQYRSALMKYRKR